MRRISVGWAVVLMVACGEDSVCEKAADKMDECKIAEAVAQQGFARLPLVISRDDCSGDNECFATCVDAATCAELEAVIVRGFSSTDPNQPPVPTAGKLDACLMECRQ